MIKGINTRAKTRSTRGIATQSFASSSNYNLVKHFELKQSLSFKFSIKIIHHFYLITLCGCSPFRRFTKFPATKTSFQVTSSFHLSNSRPAMTAAVPRFQMLLTIETNNSEYLPRQKISSRYFELEEYSFRWATTRSECRSDNTH